jgi:hypothetical protein
MFHDSDSKNIISDSTIVDCKNSGVEVLFGSHLTILNTKIKKCNQGMLLWKEHGNVKADNLEIKFCETEGLLITETKKNCGAK